MTLRQHEIAEANHRILNPLTEEKLLLLGEVCRLRAGQRQLDLACGKGEMLCRWADRFGISGHGIDISDVFLTAARARAAELGVGRRVSFQKGDAGKVWAETQGTDDGPSVPVERGAFDVVSCIGATWIGGGLRGTVELMLPAVGEGGLLLVGEPYWIAEPPAEAHQALGVKAEEFTSLVGTCERLQASGVELVEMVLADRDSWDRYVAAQWWTVEEWLRANPDHEEAAGMREFLVKGRRSYLEYGRQYLGWGVFVGRARPKRMG